MTETNRPPSGPTCIKGGCGGALRRVRRGHVQWIKGVKVRFWLCSTCRRPQQSEERVTQLLGWVTPKTKAGRPRIITETRN